MDFTQETTATITLEIAPDPGGPWQSARTYTFRAAWPPGEDRFTGQFLMDPLSPDDWFRFTFSGAPPPAYGQITTPEPICPNEATPGITATSAATVTPTATSTPMILCDTFPEGASGWCSPGGSYTLFGYDFSFYTYCGFTQQTSALVRLETAPSASGPWTERAQDAFGASWPPGSNVFTGTLSADYFAGDSWYKISFSGAPPPAYGQETSPAPLCSVDVTPGITVTPDASATRTPSPSPTPPALCDTFLFDATTTCAGGSYHYRFAFYTYCETETVPATLRLEVAPAQTGPWTLQDQRDFTAVFPPGSAVFEGDFFEPHIPPPAQWYRITFSGAPPPAYGGVAGPALACTAEATPTATPTPPVYCTPAPSPTLCPIRFVDVAEGDYFARPVIYLACAGAISGYADGTFRPYSGTTRAQLVKIVWLAVHGTSLPPGPATATFADVPPGAPFYAVVEAAAAGGLVSGYACGGPGEPCDSTNWPYFRPNAGVTRAQVAKVVVRAAGWALYTPANPHFADVPPPDPFYGYVEAALLHGVLSGYTCGGPGEPCDAEQRPYFRPGNPATRGQIAKIVYEVASRPPGCVP